MTEDVVEIPGDPVALLRDRQDRQLISSGVELLVRPSQRDHREDRDPDDGDREALDERTRRVLRCPETHRARHARRDDERDRPALRKQHARRAGRVVEEQDPALVGRVGHRGDGQGDDRDVDKGESDPGAARVVRFAAGDGGDEEREERGGRQGGDRHQRRRRLEDDPHDREDDEEGAGDPPHRQPAPRPPRGPQRRRARTGRVAAGAARAWVRHARRALRCDSARRPTHR